MTAGVYQIRNTGNGKVYVGSSADVKKRKSQHWSDLRRSRRYNSHLQSAWNKYGENSFEFETLITCHPAMCTWYEQQFLDQWKPEYNILPTAGSRLGAKHTDETRAKMSKIQKGRKTSEETKAKLRQANLGKKASAETRRKMSEALMGHKHSEESKAKMRGEKSPNAKLTAMQVGQIRKLYATGQHTQMALGKMFRVDTSQIGHIINRKQWAHI